MAEPSRAPRLVLTSQEADELDQEILELARLEGRRLATLPGRLTSRSPKKPEISARLMEMLRDELSRDVVIAKDAPSGRIDELEWDHEISKKALIGLRSQKLRELAREFELPVGGDLEALATRVASHLSWKREEIAKVIASMEQDDSDRAYISRLFPLRAPAELPQILEQLRPLEGRYIRVGVARWIVFGDAAPSSEAIRISGSFRAYRAGVDVRRDQAEIHAVASEQDFSVRLGARALLEIQQGGQQAASFAVTALGATTDLEVMPFVPNSGAGAAGIPGTVHKTSEFMLDLLHTRLREAGFDHFDLKTVKFQLPDAERKNTDPARPALRAVRFEGAYLLDSVDACRLLVVDGRPMVEMAFSATFPAGEDDALRRVSIRLVHAESHVQIQTNFGDDPNVASLVHRQLVTAVSEETQHGVRDETRLAALAADIAVRAGELETPNEASILVEDEAVELEESD